MNSGTAALPNKIELAYGVAYGVSLKGYLPAGFQPYLLSSANAEAKPEQSLDVSYRLIDNFPESDEFWVGENINSAVSSRFALFKQADGFGLSIRCQGCGLFRFSHDKIEIEWLAHGDGAAHYFFSYAMPLWLEFNGMPVLHASAVSLADKAVAFIGHSGAGKSTLAASLVRSGYDMISDDALPLGEGQIGVWHCFPGPPLFRLWPSSLQQQLQISPEKLPKVYKFFEKRLFAETRVDNTLSIRKPELAAIYLLQRRPETTGKVVFAPFSTADSVIRLIEYSLASAPATALGLAPTRLAQFSRLANSTQIKILSYPSGHSHVAATAAAIAEDVDVTRTPY